ncbi:MAG: hypothetical protein JW869_03750 [Candidatus Omnitrophica bacterium]|nr:hypothetical protein [Candidatus Omnitrophota bacterium]
MKRDKLNNILLSVIGVFGILTSIGIELWLFTLGLMIVIYSCELNKEIGPFIGLCISAFLGLLPAIVGVGVLRRNERSRKILFWFWTVVSAFIVGLILLSIKDILANTSLWITEAVPWLCIAIIGILQVRFLNSNSVKKLFNLEKAPE